MRLGLTALIGSAFAAFALSACSQEPDLIGEPEPVFHAETDPVDALAWGQFRIEDGALVLADGVTPYDLNTQLFTDYAMKLRTVWLPTGAEPAVYDGRETFSFPIGTVITKTFYYPRAGGGFDRVVQSNERLAHFDGRRLDLSEVRLIETRILVRREAGWDALPYVWREDQRSAPLMRIGSAFDLTLVALDRTERPLGYLTPDVNQCAGCHETDTTAGDVRPIGPKARHLNSDFAYFEGTANQLAVWSEGGLLAGAPDAEAAPRNTLWSYGEVSLVQLDATARSYLDINCAHCHSRTGPADTSGLYLEPWEPSGPNLGLCKPPIAAGRGTGGRVFSIVPGDAEASILHHRMVSERADIMMPELGRALSHAEGAALIAQWIDAMTGGCA
ncbi:MAG: SO2930 family diheme c-type cytochrome [Pseudomonadota bacterium]